MKYRLIKNGLNEFYLEEWTIWNNGVYRDSDYTWGRYCKVKSEGEGLKLIEELLKEVIENKIRKVKENEITVIKEISNEEDTTETKDK